MKSKEIELEADDKKAKSHVLESLAICAHDHLLSQKLLSRLATADGPFVAIVPDWIPLEHLSSYSDGTLPPSDALPYKAGDYPQDRLVTFVKKFLRATRDGIVLCEFQSATREHVNKWKWPPPQVVFNGDNDIYSVLTPSVTDPELIEAGVIARGHWQTGVCSHCAQVPDEDISHGTFLNEIVENIVHIFMPAFDDGGFLIWTPENNQGLP